MSFLILVRHGQSIWNLERKFTGWVDVDLTEQGKNEAKKAGSLIKDKHIEINYFYLDLKIYLHPYEDQPLFLYYQEQASEPSRCL